MGWVVTRWVYALVFRVGFRVKGLEFLGGLHEPSIMGLGFKVPGFGLPLYEHDMSLIWAVLGFQGCGTWQLHSFLISGQI